MTRALALLILTSPLLHACHSGPTRIATVMFGNAVSGVNFRSLEGETNVLDHSAIVFASALRDRNSHEMHNLPVDRFADSTGPLPGVLARPTAPPSPASASQ